MTEALAIDRFRQILFLPLTFASGNTAARSLADAMRADSANWTEIMDGLDHALSTENLETDPPTRARDEEFSRYQEFVYFHDFARKYLFGRRGMGKDAAKHEAGGQASQPVLQIFRRKHVAKVRLDLSSEKPLWKSGVEPARQLEVKTRCIRTLELDVDRINFYIAASGVAMLAVEVSGEGKDCVTRRDSLPLPLDSLNLDDLLDFGDRFRRVYAPYWDEFLRPDSETHPLYFLKEDNGEPLRHFLPGRAPLAVNWLDQHGTALPNMGGAAPQAVGLGDLKSIARLERPDHPDRQPPMFDWWTCLLPAAKTGREPQFPFRQIVDERMLTMTFVSAAKHAGIGDGDLMRLCFADSPGDSGKYPQDARFLSNGRFERENSYMRFRHPEPGHSTRYYNCGYNFVALGGGDYFDREIEKHFRRQYFQIGLVTHLQTAALLAFSQRISKAVSPDKGPLRADANFIGQLADIEDDFLRFTHNGWFAALTNQVQGTELYDLWRRQTRLADMHGEVARELSASLAFLDAHQQSEIAKNGMVLNVVAAVGLMTSIAVGLLSAGAFFDKDGPLMAALRPGAGSPLASVLGWNLLVALTLLATTVWIGSWGVLALQARLARGDKSGAIFSDLRVRALAWLTLGVAALLFAVKTWPVWCNCQTGP